MARSSSQDPIEKFRFKVAFFSIDDLSGNLGFQQLTTAAASAVRNAIELSVIRTGFSEVTLPSATINTMTYRENIDNQRFSKGPGLVKYDPVVLRRGVTENRDLYEWYRLVNNDTAFMGAAQEIGLHAPIPSQNEFYKKEVIITVLDREGNTVKQWMLFNAYPSKYSGGDGLNAQSEEKLVEELTLEYEFFLELDKDGLAKELVKDVGIIVANELSNYLGMSLPFVR